MKYNLKLILFWGPGSPFQNNWKLREEYRNPANRLVSLLGGAKVCKTYINIIVHIRCELMHKIISYCFQCFFFCRVIDIKLWVFDSLSSAEAPASYFNKKAIIKKK